MYKKNHGMCQMVHTVYFFVCKLSARPQFSIFHFQLLILKNFRSGIICFFTLQTVFPTLIFNFQFSILHLIKAVFTNRVRWLAVSQIKKSGNRNFALKICCPTLIFNLNLFSAENVICGNFVQISQFN